MTLGTQTLSRPGNDDAMQRLLSGMVALALVLVGCGSDAGDGAMAPMEPESEAEQEQEAEQKPVAEVEEPVEPPAAEDDAEPVEPVEEAGSPLAAPELEGCGIDSGWAGDEYCLEPPDPADGFQLHFGPSDYDDAEEVDRHVLAPGSEALRCAYIVTPNDEEVYYTEWLNQLRPGSHHMIVTMTSADVTEGSGVPCDQGGGVSSEGIVGGNTTSVSQVEEVAPEHEGYARAIPARTGISMQLHYFNTSDEPVLMEAWQNIYYEDPDDVVGLSSPLEGFAGLGMAVQPGTREIISGDLVAPQTMHVMDLYAHHHDHTQRFSAYLRRAGDDERTLVYESFDWEEPLFLPFDSIHMNPEPVTDEAVPGGHTGQLILEQGDALEWECEILNDDLDFALTFANLAHEGEMCILRGTYAPSLGRSWSAYHQ